MTLTGRSLVLSQALARIALSSAVVTRRHSVTDRSSATVPSLTLDGVHVAGATSLRLQLSTTGDYMRGTIPEGLVLTIAGTDYTAAADAEDNREDRIVVTVTPGLAAEAPDETAVTLADAVTDTHSKVNLRPATSSEVDRGAASRIDVSTVAAFPGHLAPRWIEDGDEVTYTYPDGRTAAGRADLVEQTTWGQRVFS